MSHTTGNTLRNAITPLKLLAVFLVFSVLGAFTPLGATSSLAPSGRSSAVTKDNSITEPGERYVALGDSYGAGTGADRTPLQLEDSVWSSLATQPCGKKQFSAPNILAQWDQLDLTDVTCSGARTNNILDKKQHGEAPQIEKVPKDTQIITLIIGANDIRLMQLSSCIKDPETDCTKKIESTSVAATADRLKLVIQRLAETAPRATILVTGYPLIFPAPGDAKGTCEDFLSDSEQQAIYRLQLSLNDAIRQAAGTEKSAVYVDPLAGSSPFMRRDNGLSRNACSTNPLRGMNGPDDGPSGVWHPNIFGQQYYNELYQQALRPKPAPYHIPAFTNPLSYGQTAF